MNNISKGTLIRTIVMIIMLVNTALTASGFNPLPFDETQLTNIVTIIFNTVVTLIVWWKNNNITPEAVQAHEQMKQMKIENKYTKSTGGTL